MRGPRIGLILGILFSFRAFSQEPGTVVFNRDVRPILSDKCFLCHGPDAATKNVPVRLDLEAEAKRNAIVPGKPEASPLMQRITHAKPALRMPPRHSTLTLTEDEIETLRRWISQGAVWQKHWAFLKPEKAPLPPSQEQAHPVDAWVQARLAREGLQFAPPARWETLLRRVALDLTGLPPATEEVDSFLRKPSHEAYSRFVDRLLASPRYAERMAMRWLDAARYADSNGYQFDGERQMWRWRDWVIQAFHRNMPWDRFTLEQIAGDLLPDARRDQIIATGFSRNHRGNTEDGIIPEEYQVEYVVDRVQTASTVFLGLTMGCARCHNHKYDPLPQKEFYRMFAYFNNIPENGRAMKYGNSPPLIAAPTEDQQAALERLDARIAKLERTVESSATPASFAPAAGLRWRPKEGQDAFFPEPALPLEAPNAAQFDIEDAFTLSAWVFSEKPLEGALLTRMSNTAQGKGFGMYARQGRLHVHFTSNYADDAIRLDTEETLVPGRWQHVAMTYSGSRMAEGIEVRIDGRPARKLVTQDTLYRPFRNAGQKFRQPFRIGAGGGDANLLQNGRLRDVLVYRRVLAPEELEILSSSESTPAERRRLYLESAASPHVQQAWRELERARLEREQLVRSFPTVMVMREMAQRRPTHLLTRGEYNKPAELVEPGTPEVLPPLPGGAPPNRLGLGQWMVSPENPLLARVTVNRFWQMLFGTGLVKTVEDFGSQGEPPSHPELLDWLAVEFRESGWDVKRLLKLIVMSQTYRQSSAAAPELLARDPDNRLLARGPRFRLPAEMIRDQALYVSGLLKEKIGGPSVKPWQPEGLWKEISMQDMDYVPSEGDDRWRRSLYTFWKRTIAPPMMVNFDAAGREACVVRETRTNTPLQALNLMNDRTFLEAARFLAHRVRQETDEAKDEGLSLLFRRVLLRAPTGAERQVLERSLAFHREYFKSDAMRARQYLGDGERPPCSAEDEPELAAWTAVASLVLNLDEALTKE
jgi:hypothetical protein